MRRTLKFGGGGHKVYYAIYRLMLELGAKFSHVLRVLWDWRPRERVEIPGVAIVTERLVVFGDGGFARYYVGLGDTSKRWEWVYMSLDTLRLIIDIASRSVPRVAYLGTCPGTA